MEVNDDRRVFVVEQSRQRIQVFHKLGAVFQGLPLA